MKQQSKLRGFLADRFGLHEDSASEKEIIDSIRKNIEFRGANLWSLIFAIFIASIGLNVNSTAVIIGAMLVSPLMGPIMGVGLGIGINDMELIRKASKNLLIAAAISIAVSALYFFITPLHDAQSELLARTNPSIWDVFIAIFGGLAGIVGGTRKEKSNVIPGVAIATALMPPLCTAGYGVAVGNMYFFLGALYLFFINSVFICLSTFVVVRYMKLPKKTFENREREQKVMNYILAVVLLTVLPSIYLAYKIVDKSIYESNAARFVNREFEFDNTYVINKSYYNDSGKKSISLLLIGDDLPTDTINSIRSRLASYKLDGINLIVRQGVNAKQQIDFSKVRASLIDDIFAKQQAVALANKEKQEQTSVIVPDTRLRNELKVLYPDMVAFSITKSVRYNVDTPTSDTVLLFVCDFIKPVNKKIQTTMADWLRHRLEVDTLAMIVQVRGR